ncbi:hypothetical protein BFJ66_g3817 [Fusarium oxysporum f. sp. cepae]|uniref:Uncharacterized protein n=1 Tax=Fusarium oxysporum f. sp. cepae TaxID=396571 RepID=A0A3L6NB63_FUSOX|nr:hypothetical protein BFJ65_g11522 [Fusarium oxysporum f. sp. cepae]RKK56200.1 hypothetical protein BFJ66_g3817 [Fusarium oxysporum f. sp. cepae]RKK60064.1 hypothetical protein BFJ67_g2397 [Fusarium oxysporum f. sp. cepae]
MVLRALLSTRIWRKQPVDLEQPREIFEEVLAAREALPFVKATLQLFGLALVPSKLPIDYQPASKVPRSLSEQRGFDENGYLPDQGEFALGGDDSTPQVQEERRRDSPTPARFRRDDMMIHFPTADEMEQVRREMAQFRQHLDTETTERGRLIERLTTEQSVAIEGLKTEHAKALTRQALLINELKARLNSRETGDQALSERLSQFEATQSEQAEAIKYLQKENERLNQAVRSANRAQTPTPVDPPLPQPEEAPQCDSKDLGILSTYPPGFSFPSRLQTPIPVSNRESFQGPGLRRRNPSLRNKEGYGDSAVEARKKRL